MFRLSLSLSLASALLALPGCQIVPEAQPDPTRFFVLEYPDLNDAPLTGSAGSSIGLLRVRLPVYLSGHRALAVTGPGHQVAYREFQRWAEPLDDSVARVLRQALLRSEGISRVLTIPFPLGVTRDLDLAVDIIHCEGFDRDGEFSVRFALDYTLASPSGDLVAQGIFQAPAREWNGQPGQLSALLSQAVLAAAQTIAQAVP